MRLDAYIAATTGLSRKDAKRAISAGEVRLDQSVCQQASARVAPGQEVSMGGEPLTLPGERYLMLNKPAGVVSATEDGLHLTALSLLPADLRRDLHLVGRLDLDTTGLLLLTSDGQWSHRITSPRRQCPKTYRVTLAEAIDEDALGQLARGVMLRNDPQRTAPAKVIRVDEQVIDLTITEGRYHQVKRMLASVGNHVTALHRLAIGQIHLDPGLTPGEFRSLTNAEIASVAGR